MEEDLAMLVALHEPSGAPQSVLAKLSEALVREREIGGLLEMDPDVKQNLCG